MKTDIKTALAALTFGSVCTLATLDMNVMAAESYYKGSALQSLINGKVLRTTHGGVITYNRDGSYIYKGDGRTSRGTWNTTRTKVCVKFPSRRRCDRYVKDGSSIYFESARGSRYKIRSIQ